MSRASFEMSELCSYRTIILINNKCYYSFWKNFVFKSSFDNYIFNDNKHYTYGITLPPCGKCWYYFVSLQKSNSLVSLCAYTRRCYNLYTICTGRSVFWENLKQLRIFHGHPVQIISFNNCQFMNIYSYYLMRSCNRHCS